MIQKWSTMRGLVYLYKSSLARYSTYWFPARRPVHTRVASCAGTEDNGKLLRKVNHAPLCCNKQEHKGHWPLYFMHRCVRDKGSAHLGQCVSSDLKVQSWTYDKNITWGLCNWPGDDPISSKSNTPENVTFVQPSHTPWNWKRHNYSPGPVHVKHRSRTGIRKS